MDREAAGSHRTGGGRARRGFRSRDARSCEARAAAAPPGACRTAWPDRLARQHPEPALALGIVQPQRPHLLELASGDDAGFGAGLRADPRADALEAHGSLAEILEAGCGGVPGLPERARLSSCAPELKV